MLGAAAEFPPSPLCDHWTMDGADRNCGAATIFLFLVCLPERCTQTGFCAICAACVCGGDV